MLSGDGAITADFVFDAAKKKMKLSVWLSEIPNFTSFLMQRKTQNLPLPSCFDRIA
jgi:hypothetical protein